MDKLNLTLKKVQNVTAGIVTEIKENLKMKNGLATIKSVIFGTRTKGDTEYRCIDIEFEGIEGGGCFDSVTMRTPSKARIGLHRIKYLFNALGATLPELDYFKYATLGADDEVSKIVSEALQDAIGRGLDANESAFIDDNSTIIFNSLNVFNDVFGDDAPVDYYYLNGDEVNKIRKAHRKAVRATEDAEEIESLKQAYYADLNAQPVVPCQMNESAFETLAQEIEKLGGEDADEVFIKTDRNGSQVVQYSTEE
jgi:hypothetical protein